MKPAEHHQQMWEQWLNMLPWGEARQSPLLSSAPKVATSVGMPVPDSEGLFGPRVQVQWVPLQGGACLCQPIPRALGKVFPGSLAEHSRLWTLSFRQVTPGHCSRPQHVAHGDSIP